MGAAFPEPNQRKFSNKNIRQDNNDYIAVIRRLNNLLPIDSKDKLNALEEVIIYVSSMLYGDDLHQFYSYNNYKKYATKALDELVVYVQEHSLAQYRQELDSLRIEIDALKSEKELLLKRWFKIIFLFFF